jgi:hypothetical protein
VTGYDDPLGIYHDWDLEAKLLDGGGHSVHGLVVVPGVIFVWGNLVQPFPYDVHGYTSFSGLRNSNSGRKPEGLSAAVCYFSIV